MNWPRDFIWGTGASSTQSEGAAPSSDWHEWELQGRAPTSDRGNGFGELFDTDFAILASLGLIHHRLSLEWARLEPRQGHYDRQAIDKYREILSSARSHGIHIWVCESRRESWTLNPLSGCVNVKFNPLLAGVA